MTKIYFFLLIFMVSLASCGNSSESIDKTIKITESATDATIEKELADLRAEKKRYYAMDAGAERKELAKSLLARYNQFSIDNPKHEATPKILLNMAEMYEKDLGNYDEAFGLYNEIYAKYPNSDVAPHALLMQGMVFHQVYKNEAKAKELFLELKHRFPNHILVSMADDMLAQIGKDPDSLYQEIKQKKEGE